MVVCLKPSLGDHRVTERFLVISRHVQCGRKTETAARRPLGGAYTFKKGNGLPIILERFFVLLAGIERVGHQSRRFRQ